MISKGRASIGCLFVDIGGVLLSDGWNHISRAKAVETFGMDRDRFEIRHRAAFATYEEGKLSLSEYLDYAVFDQSRSFTREEFQAFMSAQSTPFPRMIELVRKLKADHGLKVFAVSNEARELNAFRIQKFELATVIDTFVSSCFVRMRKPDPDMFRLALDLSQVPAEETIYIENTAMFVEIAESLGIRSILHTDFDSTCAKLATFGLSAAP